MEMMVPPADMACLVVLNGTFGGGFGFGTIFGYAERGILGADR
jgi:hypothetical protein